MAMNRITSPFGGDLKWVENIDQFDPYFWVTLAGNADPPTIISPTGTVTLTGAAPTLTIGFSFPAAGSVTLAGSVPQLALGTVTPGTGVIRLTTGQAPLITAGAESIAGLLKAQADVR